MRVRLARFDSVVEAENAMLALEAGGIEAFDSVETTGIPGLGQTSLLEVFVIEVEEADLARAEELLRGVTPPAVAPEPVGAPEKPVELRESLVASYRRASTLMLSGGVLSLTVAVAVKQAAPQHFGAVIWDFLIWRMMHDASAPPESIMRARRFAQYRIVATVVALFVSSSPSSPVTWVAAATIALCFLLYLPAPETPAPEAAKTVE